MATRTEKSKCGRGWPADSRKAHYFLEDGRALCGAWLFFGELDDDKHNSPDNCAACKKRLAKMTAPAREK